MVFRINNDVLRQQFADLGVIISDTVLEKCREICITNRVDEEELVEQWMAYTTTNLNGADPTVENLTQMERNTFSKVNTDPSILSSKSQNASSTLVVYNADTISSIIGDDFDLLKGYDTTPRGKDRPTALRTPEHSLARRGDTHSPRTLFSPKSFSPIVSTPSRKYATRSNSGQTVCEFGGESDLEWQNPHHDFFPKVSLLPFGIASEGQIKQYMFETLQDKALALNDLLHRVGDYIVAKHNLDEPRNIKVPEVESFVAVGRICCDSSSRLNASSVLLEGSRSLCSGETVYLDFQQQTSYSLFPGQIVAVEGLNPTGNRIMVQKVYSDGSMPFPTERPRLSENNGPLHIMVASGPFTQTDSMIYEPLHDFIEQVEKYRPHVVILIGPFLDMYHPHVAKGLVAETYDDLFVKIIDCFIEAMKKINTQVVIVPSFRDVHHHMIYPTPPYSELKHHSNVLFAPDPCLIDIEGVIIGVTSVDVMMHLAKEEISSFTGMDRLSRLANHLISQQSFYPLYPVDDCINVDIDLMERFARLEVTPHVLIVPSDLRYFIKDINGCVVINPEHLAKGEVGGNYARIQISPPKSEDKTCVNVTKGEIIKI